MRANCPTCYELLTCTEDLVCLPCGHVFHYHCTVQWFQSKKNCPQCRHPANEKNARKIFLSEADDLDTDKSPEDLQQQIDSLQLQVRVGKCDLENLKKDNSNLQEINKKLKEEMKVADKSKRDAESKAKELKYRMKSWLEEREQYVLMQIEFDQVKSKLAKYSLLEKTLEGSIGDVNAMLHERGSFSGESRDLATTVVELKKKLLEVKRSNALFDRKISELESSREEDRRKIKSLNMQVCGFSELKEKLVQSRDKISSLENNVEELEEENKHLKRTNERLKRRKCDPGKENKLSDAFRIENSESDEEEEILSNDLLSNDLLSNDLTYMESPKPSFKSCAIAAGEKRKAFSQLSSQDSNKIEPLSQSSSQGSQNKRPKYRNLLEIGTLSYQDGKGYDGFGGRSKPDVFPEPNLILKRPNNLKKPVLSRPIKKGNIQAKLEKNQQTVDKFFGSFDTP